MTQTAVILGLQYHLKKFILTLTSALPPPPSAHELVLNYQVSFPCVKQKDGIA